MNCVFNLGIRFIPYVLLCIMSFGCVGPIERLFPPRLDESAVSIYLLNHFDWHTGVVIRRQDIPNQIWPAHYDFAGFEYLEVGWGDRDYYQAGEPTTWMTIKAAFWPTSSVLHIVGFNAPVEKFFPESEIIEITLSSRGFEQLCIFIRNSYAREERGKTINLGPGLLENSRFYAAKGKFHFLRTCNVWIAEALRAAGCPITSPYSIGASNVMYQARKFGNVIRSIN
jgi:uncharacterized protein (TIGR02117 family)